MLELEERALTLRNLKPELDDLAAALGIEAMKREVAELEQQAAQLGFWDDTENSQKVLKRTGTLKGSLEEYENLTVLWDDAMTMVEMAEEEEDASMIPEIDEMMHRLTSGIETERLSTLLSGEYDSKDAILTFHAGAGGTEAQDVQPLGRGTRLQGDPAGLPGRRRGRHQERLYSGGRPQCLRLPEI